MSVDPGPHYTFVAFLKALNRIFFVLCVAVLDIFSMNLVKVEPFLSDIAWTNSLTKSS